MRLAPKEKLARGVYTASAGNMAQGVAWNARALGISQAEGALSRAPRFSSGTAGRGPE